MTKINPIVKCWLTPKFPVIHYKDEVGPLKKWIANPIKRRLAKWYLMIIKKTSDIKVIGITGSAGKTTTKEMLASILKLNGKTVYSEANIDPIYNIPNTILKTTPGTKYLILEMGVEYPGEMDFYLWLAKPDVGVITNIYPTHLEFLKDENGVLSEKSKLVLGLEKDGIAVMNSDDEKLKNLTPSVKSKIVWFQNDSDQLVTDGYAAAAIADSLGITKDKIFDGLKDYEKPKHRLSLFRTSSGAVILDDSYNSNPKALLSTLDLFNKKAGKNNKFAVLGDMKELGELEEKFHRDIGKVIAKQGFQAVIGVGDLMKYLVDEVNKDGVYTEAIYVKSLDDVMQVLKPYLLKDNYILIKGSRSVGLDKVADALI